MEFFNSPFERQDSRIVFIERFSLPELRGSNIQVFPGALGILSVVFFGENLVTVVLCEWDQIGSEGREKYDGVDGSSD